MQENLKDYKKIFNARLVPSGFSYESGNNPEFLSVEQIRSLIKTLINPEFSPY
jgi:hypothetical protein